MGRTRHFSSLLLVVALSPIFFQTTYSCERGNASLAVLEFHADEQDRIHGFSADNLEYDVFNTSPSVTVTTGALDPASIVSYQWVVDGAPGDTTGIRAGGGSAEMALPAGEGSFQVTVRAPEGAFRSTWSTSTRLAPALPSAMTETHAPTVCASSSRRSTASAT